MTVVDLVERTAGALADWVAALSAGYVDEQVAAGEDRDDAEQRTAAQMAAFFPEGECAEGQHLYQALDGDVLVGHLWVGRRSANQPDAYWVYFVEVEPAHRGQGYGRGLMEAAEGAVLALGGTSLGLNVFGQNVVARTLYGNLGYEVTSQQMRKELRPPTR